MYALYATQFYCTAYPITYLHTHTHTHTHTPHPHTHTPAHKYIYTNIIDIIEFKYVTILIISSHLLTYLLFYITACTSPCLTCLTSTTMCTDCTGALYLHTDSRCYGTLFNIIIQHTQICHLISVTIFSSPPSRSNQWHLSTSSWIPPPKTPQTDNIFELSDFQHPTLVCIFVSFLITEFEVL